MVEQAGVGGQVGARRTPDRLLVDPHHAPDAAHAVHDAPFQRHPGRRFQLAALIRPGRDLVPEFGRRQLDQHLADQARFAGTGHAGHAGHHAQREFGAKLVQVVAGDPFQAQPVLRLARRARGRRPLDEQVAPRLRILDRLQPPRRAAVQDLAALLARMRADVDDPVRVADHIERVLDHEQRIARGLELAERGQQRLGVGRVQAGRRFIEDVHDAEQVGAYLRCKAQALQLSRRQGRRAAFEREVAEAEVEQHVEARHQVGGDALHDDQFFGMFGGRFRVLARASAGVRAQQARQPFERHARDIGDVVALEPDRQRFWPQPLAVAQRAVGADHVARRALLHRGAFGVGEGLQHVAARAGKGALVARRLLALECAPGFFGREPGIHRNGRLLVGKQDPVARLLRQVAPWRVDVVAEGDQDVAQVLAVPRGRPGGHRAFADGQRVVRHHRLLGHLIHAPEAVALRARAFRRIRRKRFGVQQLLAARVIAGARIQHAQRIGQGADAADRRACGRRTALLLQRDCGRQAVDVVDLGHRHLVEQAARVGRHRFEVAPLGFRVQGAEGERGFAGTGYAGEHDQRIARDLEADVLQVVLARAAHLHKARVRLVVSVHCYLGTGKISCSH